MGTPRGGRRGAGGRGRGIVLDVAARQYHALNRTGALLWHRLENDADTAELAQLLTEKYDLAADAAGADVTAFLARLEELDLVREVGA